MPNRIIKESVCTSPTIDLLTPEEEVCFYRLWTKCDDFGRYYGRASVVHGACFPLKAERNEVTPADVESWLRKLNAVDLIKLYTVKDTRYLQVTTWEEHQKRRAEKSKFPDPLPDDDTCEQLKTDVDSCGQMRPYSVSETYSKTISPSHVDAHAPTGRKFFDESSEPYRLSILLCELMLRNNPKAKVPKPTPQTIAKWAEHIDGMIRLDERSPDDIEAVIRWSQDDEFWMTNILSTRKLRDKYDQLWLRMTRTPRWQKSSYRHIDEVNRE